jgi:hypothetical protein
MRCFAVFVILSSLVLAAAWADEADDVAQALDASSDDAVIVTSVDAGLPTVGPGRTGRVGLWPHGSSFEEDAAFFAVEDEQFRAFFIKQQEKLKQQKRSERRTNYDAKKRKDRKEGVEDDANTAEDATFMTLSSINMRTANRRKVLDKKDVPLATKLKTLTIDVKAFTRRFRKSQVLNTSNQIDRDYANIVTRDFPHAAAVNATPRSGFLGPLLATWPYYQPLPQVLLDETVLKTFVHELDQLTVDAKVIDGEYHRAELGLHENEKKLRETTLKKGSTEVTTEHTKPTDSDSKSVAAADPQRKKAEERLLGYKETRETAIREDVFKPLQQARQVLNNNLEHHHCIMKATLPLLVAQLPALRAARAALEQEMARNDESTAAKRREMKELTKKAHASGKSIKDREGLIKYFGPRIRRHATSSVDNLLLALELTAQLRELTSAPNATIGDWVTEWTGLNIPEIKRLVAQPVAVGVLLGICWSFTYQMGVQWLLVHLARFVERRHAVHRGRVTAAARQRTALQHEPFDSMGWLLTISAFAVRFVNALLVVATTVSPLLLPLLCLWLRDSFVSPVRIPYITDVTPPDVKDLTLPTGRPYRALLYTATVLATGDQCRNLGILVAATVLVAAVTIRVLSPSGRRIGKSRAAEQGRRLGSR